MRIIVLLCILLSLVTVAHADYSLDPTSVVFTTNTEEVRIVIDDTAIYQYGYVYVNNEWKQFDLNPGAVSVGSWHLDSAQAILLFGESNFPYGQSKTYTAIYSCTWIGEWDCNGNAWQIKEVPVNRPAPDPVCGNGVLEEGEECDVGGNTACDPPYGGSCTSCQDCQESVAQGSYCGDGVCDIGFEDESTCSDCVSDPVCGNGVVEGGEQCDDGMPLTGTCTASYGSACTYCDTCETKTRQGSFCGDGVCDTGFEEAGSCSDCQSQSNDAFPEEYVAPGGWDFAPVDIDTSDWIVMDVTESGILPNGQNHRDTLNSILTQEIGSPRVLYFPPGEYTFSGGNINMQSNHILRGAGPDQTVFRYPQGDVEITWYGSVTGYVADVTSDVAEGATTIPVSTTNEFYVGSIVDIREDIDAYSGDWGKRSGGTVGRIVSLTDNSITVEPPLANGLRLSKNPEVTRIRTKENTGIEGIRLESLKEDRGTDMIIMTRVSNAFVRNVESSFTSKHHVAITQSHDVLVENSFFDNAYDKGTGGYGYGVLVQDRSSHVLVQDNILRDLRHQLAVQTGANYVVFGYNYNIDTIREQCFVNPPSWCSDKDDLLDMHNAWRESDFVVHGHYPHSTLWEGNVGYWTMADNVHEDNGPRNVFFRNLFYGQPEEYGNWAEGVGFGVDGPNDLLAVVGNVFANGATFWARDNDARDVLVGANVQNDQVVWGPLAGAQSLPSVIGIDQNTGLPNSLYLTGKPSFWGNQPWPPFGPEDVQPDMIPAQQRYAQMS